MSQPIRTTFQILKSHVYLGNDVHCEESRGPLHSGNKPFCEVPWRTQELVFYFVDVFQQRVKILTESLYGIDSQLWLNMWMSQRALKCAGDWAPSWDSSLIPLSVIWPSGVLGAPHVILLANAENSCTGKFDHSGALTGEESRKICGPLLISTDPLNLVCEAESLGALIKIQKTQLSKSIE